MHEQPLDDTTIGRLARRLAAELAAQADGSALVVLTDPATNRSIGTAIAGRTLPPGLCSITELMMPSDPIVCDPSRVHHAGLRNVARTWGASHVVLVPCLFGNDLIAIALTPAPDEHARELIQAVTPLAERFSAAVVRARLMARVLTPAVAAAG
jgi:hypothetical protein